MGMDVKRYGLVTMSTKNKKRRKKMRKEILYITLIVSFIISLFTVFANLTQTKLYIDPSSIMDKKLKVDDTFTVNVSVADVTDLKGYEFRLRYNTDILDATDVTSSPFLSSSLYCVKRVIDDSEGYIWVACMMPLGPGEGVSGSGTLETITFQVKDKGESDIDLYRTVFGDHTGESIPHTVEDGYFENRPVKEKKPK